jgi:ribonuclease P protein component
MLKKSLRLDRTLMKDLGPRPRLFHTEHFMLRTAPSPLGPRLGISVSKKVSKSAVARNRLRRRAYAAVAELIPGLGRSLYLVAAKPSAAALKAETLKLELAELLKKS